MVLATALRLEDRLEELMRCSPFRVRLAALTVCSSCCLSGSPGRAAGPLEDALDGAVKFLAAGQNADGGYGPFGADSRVENASDVGITAFVVFAIARHPRGYATVDGPFLSRAVDFLLSHQQPDGGFYHPKDPVLTNYRTCVALLALVELDRVAYAEQIRRARDFVIAQQRDERIRYTAEEHLSFGSVGHSGALRGDLSNAAFAAEAMFAAGLSASEPFWKKLDTFVSRCQNSPEVDPLLRKSGIGTTGNYGFRYAPNDTRGPKESLDDGSIAYSSYGSMTYQGLKSLLYANVSKDDPRVRGAFEWISRTFTVKENPGMGAPGDPRAGLQGLFYYYHAMAKSLSVYGEPIIEDERGVRHDWARELSAHLIQLQRPGGYWQNTSGRWWEDLPTLDTAYAMLALSICGEEIARREKAGTENPGGAPANPGGAPANPGGAPAGAEKAAGVKPPEGAAARAGTGEKR